MGYDWLTRLRMFICRTIGHIPHKDMMWHYNNKYRYVCRVCNLCIDEDDKILIKPKKY